MTNNKIIPVFLALIGVGIAVAAVLALVNQNDPVVPEPQPKRHLTEKPNGRRTKPKGPVELPRFPPAAQLERMQQKRLAAALKNERAIISESAKKPATEEMLFSLATNAPAEAIGAVAFSPNGKLLAGIGFLLPDFPTDHAIHLWDLRERKRLGMNYVVGTEIHPPLLFSPNGKLLVALGREIEPDAWCVLIWNARTGELRQKRHLLGWSRARSVTFSPDSGVLVAVGEIDSGNSLRWFRTKDLTELPLISVPPKTFSAAFSPDGRYLATGHTDKALIWELPKVRKVKTIAFLGDAHPLIFTPDSKHLAGIGSANLNLIEIGTWKATTLPVPDSDTRRAEFVGAGKLLALGWANRPGVLVRVPSLETVAGLYDGDSADFACSPGGRLIAWGSPHSGGQVGVWKTATILDPALDQVKSIAARARALRQVEYVERNGQTLSVVLSATAENKNLANVSLLPFVNKLEIHGRVSDAGLVHLKRMKQLRELALIDLLAVTGPGLAHLERLTELRKLRLTKTKILEDNYKYLQRLNKLEHFEPGTLVSDKTLELIKGLTSLTELLLSDAQITDKGMPHLAAMTKMKRLALANTKVSDAGLKSLQKMKDLQWLDLSDTRIEALSTLNVLPKLKVLKLSGSTVEDKGLAAVKKLPRLQELWLENTGNIKGPGLIHLQDAAGIKSLDLFSTNIEDSGFVNIRHLQNVVQLAIPKRITDFGLRRLKLVPHLQVLSLNEIITNKGLVHLSGLKELKTLILLDSQITDKGLAQLTPLTALKSLDLSGTRISGSSLTQLQPLQGLQEIMLARTGITDATVTKLSALKNLQYIDLRNTRVTAQGVAKLREGLKSPKLVIAK